MLPTFALSPTDLHRQFEAPHSYTQLPTQCSLWANLGKSVIGNVQARQPRQLADRVWYLTTQKVSVKLSAHVRSDQTG